MNLYCIVGILVTVLAGHHLQHGSEHIGVALILLHLLTLFRCQLTGLCDEAVRLVYIHETCGLVQNGAGSLELGLHHGQHLVHSRELYDCLAELTALAGVLVSLTVSSLGYTC